MKQLIHTHTHVSFQDGINALMFSAHYGHNEEVTLLCQRGANIEARDVVSKSRLSLT